MSPNPRIKYPLLLVKILHYEFWPFWVLYFPAIFYWFYNAIITRSLTYFTLANPGIDYGGVFGESKIDILKKIPLTYLPTTLFFEPQTTGSQIKEEMQRANLIFPVICKPDKGEMGFKVAKIENDDQLNTYLANSTDRIILQEFIEYEIELGVLYYRMPNDNHSGITSIVGKEFLQVVGDGCSSIRELINKTDRGRLQLKSLEYRLKDQFDKVLPNNHRMIVEPIGNHCRGTRFINRNDLITPELIKVFDQIATQFEGFYYGRFDLKVKTLDDLYQKKTIKILEVNGVTSEPAHIYDTSMKLPKVYKDIFHNMRVVRLIALQNKKNGFKAVPVLTLISTAIAHFRKKSQDGN